MIYDTIYYYTQSNNINIIYLRFLNKSKINSNSATTNNEINL